MEKIFKAAEDRIINNPKIIELSKKFARTKVIYNCALKEVTTKFEILNDDLRSRYNRDAIEFITGRIKTPESIIKKLQKKNLDLTIENAVERLTDIAGIRVICSFISDIYEVAEMFTKQDDIEVIEIKDYIKNPKPSGYRSLHMLVKVPVFFSCERKELIVEVQLRTIAMDFWASLEHQIYYKKDINNASDIQNRLRSCADQITALDIEMEDIHKTLQKLN